MSPHFGDARVILSGAESYAQGQDPLVNNPMDPWLRPMNYPRIWEALGWLGLNQGHTTALGLGFITLFFLGVFLLAVDIERPTAWALVLGLFSPAVMFGIERANSDLAIFFFVSLPTRIYARHPVPALLSIGMGGVLKLFPFLGFAVLLRAGRRQFFCLAVPCALLSFTYVLWTWDDILLIRASTPQSTLLSYGVKVFWMSVQAHISAPLATRVAMAFSFALVAAAGLLALWLVGRDAASRDESQEGHLAAFRAGCAIYIGSFLLISNWDYRLMFLLLTIPALCRWARGRNRPTGLLARIALPATVVACWSLGIHALMYKVHLPMSIWFVVDQASKWGVFITLLCAFTCTLPDWMRWHTGWAFHLWGRQFKGSWSPTSIQ